MGSIQYLGRLSLIEAFPILAVARLQVRAIVNLVLPDVTARLAGAVALAANIRLKPPSLSASVVLAAKILAQLQVAITPPSVDFAVAACASLIAQLGSIKAALDLALNWGVFPGSVHVFVYQGAAQDMGATVTAYISGGGLAGVVGTSKVIAPFVVVETADVVSTTSLQAMIKVG